MQRLNSLPQQEAYRPPRRFSQTTLNPPKSSSEPTPVLSAHHGLLHHHPSVPTELYTNHPEPLQPPQAPAPGPSPSHLPNNPIVANAEPTGIDNQVSSLLPTCLLTPLSEPLPTTSTTISSKKNSVQTPTDKTETVTPTPLPTQANNPSSEMIDDIFSSNALPAFDWDQFLVADADRAAVEAATTLDKGAAALVAQSSQANTPVSDAATPKSTESERSQDLDVSEFFSFDDLDGFAGPAGITHDPSDIVSSFTASTPVVPDATLGADPTMLSTFGSTMANFGDLATLNTDAITQLQLGNLLSQIAAESTRAPAPTVAPSGLSEVYASLGWPLTGPTQDASTVASSPALTSVSMKRKVSEAASEDLAAKRPRGRPPTSSSTPVAKRPYRRQSKNGMSLSQLAAAAATGKPIVDQKPPLSPSPELEDDEAPVRLTATGKPSTARPKAVVPEKYMKNGEAQAITGMTTEQILSFPNWSSLMECVDEGHRAGADVFGSMITENRDKAKWAAKKSRDERKAKVESLEGQVDDLQGKIAEMRGLLLGLVGRGLVSLAEVESYI